MSTKPFLKLKSKSTHMGRRKSIVKGDVVLLSHKRIGVVRYVGDIAEFKEKAIWYGIEIRMTAGLLGDSNGSIGTTTYFKCAVNEGLFVKLPDIQRRIEPKELLQKVVKLTKIKNSMHQLLNQSHNDLTKLKRKFNVSNSPTKYDYTFTSNRNHQKQHSQHNHHNHGHHRPLFGDNNSGSINYEPSTSMSDSTDFSTTTVTNISENSKSNYNYNDPHPVPVHVAPIQVAKQLTARNSIKSYTNQEIKAWDTKQVIVWINSIRNNDNNDGNEWIDIINDVQQCQINGNDLLLMNETNSLPKQLTINSLHIRRKIMNELVFAMNSGHKRPSLLYSSSTPATTNSATVKTKHNKHVTFDDIDVDIGIDKDGKQNESACTECTQSFHELNTFFNKIDSNNDGKVDFSAFRYILIEIDPDLEPYKLTNEAIKRCFDEFDLTKNGWITIEEFIVVMGKTYLRGLSKSYQNNGSGTPLTKTEIKAYFIQIIKHFIKKGQKNINYSNSGNNNKSRRRTTSGSKPRAPPPRKGSVSKSRSCKPPPPKRDASPSNSSNGIY